MVINKKPVNHGINYCPQHFCWVDWSVIQDDGSPRWSFLLSALTPRIKGFLWGPPKQVGPPLRKTTPTPKIRMPWSMGMVWEAYGKGPHLPFPNHHFLNISCIYCILNFRGVSCLIDQELGGEDDLCDLLRRVRQNSFDYWSKPDQKKHWMLVSKILNDFLFFPRNFGGKTIPQVTTVISWELGMAELPPSTPPTTGRPQFQTLGWMLKSPQWTFAAFSQLFGGQKLLVSWIYSWWNTLITWKITTVMKVGWWT